MLISGCASPQGVLLPALPGSQSKAPRIANVEHGAEGRISADSGFVWGEQSPSQIGQSRRRNGASSTVRLSASAAGGVTLNLVEASIADAAKAVLGDVLKVNYIIDERVKGAVTLTTIKPVALESVPHIFDTVLSGHGARLVADGELYKIVPAAEAPRAGAPLRFHADSRAGQPGLSIHVVQLRYVSAEEIEPILASVAPQSAVLHVDHTRNFLLLAGTQSELAAITELIDLFDIDLMRGKSIALFPVDSADPQAIVTDLETVFNEMGRQAAVKFIPNRRLKAVLAISTDAGQLRRADEWVRRFRSAHRATERELFSYKVRNRPASVLAELLLQVYGNERPSHADSLAAGSSDPQRSGNNSTASRSASLVVPTEPESPLAPATGIDATTASPSERNSGQGSISVVADDANRMLLITATHDEYTRVQSILERIDTVPEQVIIEATIAEVTLNDELRLGLRWFFESKQHSYTLTDSVAGAIAPTFPGFSYFFNTLNMKVVLSALSDVTDVNIVSSPTLTVADGQKAVLQVGDEVPIITQQATSVVTPDAPIINSVTYRNTGVILQVIPHVHENGRVELEIEQEVSEVGASSSQINSPTIQQRRIATRVSVRDGASLAIGGLMQDRSELQRTQAPMFGDIPLLGNLFKQKADTLRRTELLIIMTPRVIRDSSHVRLITNEFRNRLNMSLRPQRQGPPDRVEQLDRLQR